MKYYWPGQAVLTHAEFYDINNNLADPTAVNLSYKKPDTSTPVTVAPIKISTGVYEYTIDTTNGAPGEWRYEYHGTGSIKGVGAGGFRLRKSLVA